MPGPSPDPQTGRARSTPLGMYDRPSKPQLSGGEMIAAAFSVLWLVGSAVYFLSLPAADETAGGPGFLVSVVAIFMPVAMIWVAATSARTARMVREDSQRLQAALNAIRQAQIAQAQRGAIPLDGAIQKKLDEIAETAKKTETALATFHTIRGAEPRPAVPAAPAAGQERGGDQGALELGTPAEALSPPLAHEDFIRALHFPETAEDEVGFNALRRALKDRKAAQLIQAAQDVLTLLSQDGIYMDDLHPDRARPEIWRQFAQGVRGREVAALGGVRDRSSLALTAARMKQDPIFRDAVHHFLRRFDQMFAAFAEEATDAEITALAETRTARAFMLVGRVAGTFD